MPDRKARVAVVQLAGRLAFTSPDRDYLGEPLASAPIGDPSGSLLGDLHARLRDHDLLKFIQRLKHTITRAYCDAFLPKLAELLKFCATLEVDLVVFPEYTIPGQLIPRLVPLARDSGCTLVAGTHLVTTALLRDDDYRNSFADPPRPNHAIAPFIGPDGKVTFQDKLWQSQWETVLTTGTAVKPCTINLRRGGGSMTVGAAICIDFLRHRDDESHDAHKTLKGCDLIAVPSHTPKHTTSEFASSAGDLFRHFHRPVAYVNHADEGGSSVFCFGKSDIRQMLPGSRPKPMPADFEGICVVDLLLDRPAEARPNTIIAGHPSEIVTYSALLHESVDRPLAALAARLRAATDAISFQDELGRGQSALFDAATRYARIEQIAERWDILAHGATHESSIDRMHMLARDLWLPDTVPTVEDTECQIAIATLQVLETQMHGPVTKDLEAIRRTHAEIKRACEKRNWKLTAEPADAIATTVTSMVFDAPAAPRPDPEIADDGDVQTWDTSGAPPPSELLQRGFRLWPACEVVAAWQTGETDEDSGLSGLLYHREHLERAATYLALLLAPPAWIGRSANDIPVLVLRSYHVVFVTPVVPGAADLQVARTVRGLPLPIVLLLGDGAQSTRATASDIVSLDHAIQRLATIDRLLRKHWEFPYTTVGAHFVEPTVRYLDRTVTGRSALNDWYASGSSSVLLSGRLADGRTSLIHMWLADLATQALHGDGPPVYYVDCRRHSDAGLAALLAELTPRERAAMRLAISSGNCLLVLDSLDAPHSQRNLPLLWPWITKNSRFILVACWLPNRVTHDVIELLPADESALKTLANEQRRHIVPPGTPRGFAAALGVGRTLQAAVLADYLAHYADILAPDAPDAFLLALEHLALAMWSPFARHRLVPVDSVPADRALRVHAERSHTADSPVLDPKLQTIAQPLLAAHPATRRDTESSDVGYWIALQLAVRGNLLADENSVKGVAYHIPWDPACLYLLASHIVRSLAAGDTSVLEILLLDAEVLDYAICLDAWPRARERLVALLLQGPTASAAANAVLLASADGTVESTREHPWQLAGADLRGLDATRLPLAHANLAGARLCGSSLRLAVLTGADLTGADLHTCDLTSADLRDAHADRADFSATLVDGTSFAGASLREADLSRSRAPKHPPSLADAVVDGLRRVDTDWAAADAPQPTPIDGITTVPPLNTSISALAWSPDGHRIAVGYASGQLELWSSGPLRCLARWSGPPAIVHALAFSPDGQRLAVVGDDPNAIIWQLADFTACAKLEHPSTLLTGTFWQDDDTLWTFAEHPRVWRISDTTILRSLDKLPCCYEGVLLSDGATLAAVRSERTANHARRLELLLLIDLASETVIRKFPGEGLCLSAVHPATDRVALLVQQSMISVWTLSPSDQQPSRVLPVDRSRRTYGPNMGWSHDGALLACLAGDDPKLVCLDGRTLELRCFPLPLSTRASGLFFSPVDARIALLRHDTFEVLDVATTQSAMHFPVSLTKSVPQAIAWTPHGLQLDLSSALQDLDFTAGRATRTPQVLVGKRDKQVSAVDPRIGSFVLVRDGVTVVRHAADREVVLAEPPVSAASLARGGSFAWSFSSDGAHVMAQRAYQDGPTTTDLWSTATGRHRLQLMMPSGTCILVHRGETLTFLRDEETLWLVDADRHAQLRCTFPASSHLAATPAGDVLVCADSTKGEVFRLDLSALRQRLLDVPERTIIKLEETELPTLWRHPAVAQSSRFVLRPEDDLLALIAYREIELRRMSTGESFARLPTELAAGPAAFSPDGRILAVASGAWLQLWRLDNHSRIMTVVRRTDDALLLADDGYQRLAGTSPPRPGMQGFFTRRGPHLTQILPDSGLERADLLKRLQAQLGSSLGQ